MKQTIQILIVFFLMIGFVSCSKQLDTPIVSKDIGSPTFGDPASKVQLVLFSDFQCPACINFEESAMDDLYKNYIDNSKIGFTFKNFPLDQHQNAMEDALAGLCAHADGKFREFAKEMYSFEKSKASDDVSDEERVNLASKIGLDTVKFKTCLEEGHYLNKIKQDKQDGERLSLRGTPSIYINGNIATFASKEELFQIIDALLKN